MSLLQDCKTYFFAAKLYSSQFLNLDYVHIAEVLGTLLSLQKPGWKQENKSDLQIQWLK